MPSTEKGKALTASLTHQTDTTEYATRADVDALWQMLQGVVDALQHEIGQVAAARGLPAPSALSPRHRAGLQLVASEGELLILKASGR